MASRLLEIIDLLKREYLFQGMSDDQLVWIADKFQAVNLDRNTVVYSEGAPGDCFYMVFRGRVRVIHRVKHEDQMLNILTPGDFFGEEALLYNVPRTSTIRTIEKTTLLRMDREHFDDVLGVYPNMRNILISTAESRRMARTKRFDWLNNDESIYFMTRKHDFFLFRALLFPIVLIVLSAPLFSFALFEIDTTPFFFWLSVIGAVLLLIAGVLLAAWRYVDWGNDFFIVTSQRVVWTEKMVALYESRREAPLDTILAVNVISSQLGRILKYGNVSVRTFTGGILMRNLNHPGTFASFVEGFKKRAQELSKEEEQRAIDRAIQQALARQQAILQDEEIYVPESPPPYPVKDTGQIRRNETPSDWLRNFLKVRYIQGDTITYRKHWFVLFRNTWIPGLLLAPTAGIVFGIPISRLVWGTALFPNLVSLGLGFTVLPFLFGWLFYQYLDWRNDIYRLTPEQIFDIEKKPFGEESKKSAPLESILSLEHERENLIGILLNYGNVVINVGQTKFDFLGVYNPDQVHQDIADYREALNRRKKAKEQEREREKMADWFVAYHLHTSAGGGEDLPDDDRFSRFQGKIR